MKIGIFEYGVKVRRVTIEQDSTESSIVRDYYSGVRIQHIHSQNKFRGTPLILIVVCRYRLGFTVIPSAAVYVFIRKLIRITSVTIILLFNKRSNLFY